MSIERFSDTIDGHFRLATVAVAVCGIVAVALPLAGYLLMRQEVRRLEQSVYVLDEGSVMTARQSSAAAQRPLEVRDHVVRFHELILNLAPSKESIEYNQRRAFTMCDESGRRYCSDLAERNFYNDVISIDASQQFRLDSLQVDCSRKPYRASLYGKLYFLRRSNVTTYRFTSTCTLVDVERSPNNPHGLLIRDFTGRQEKLEGRRR